MAVQRPDGLGRPVQHHEDPLLSCCDRALLVSWDMLRSDRRPTALVLIIDTIPPLERSPVAVRVPRCSRSRGGPCRSGAVRWRSDNHVRLSGRAGLVPLLGCLAELNGGRKPRGRNAVPWAPGPMARIGSVRRTCVPGPWEPCNLRERYAQHVRSAAWVDRFPGWHSPRCLIIPSRDCEDGTCAHPARKDLDWFLITTDLDRIGPAWFRFWPGLDQNS